MTDSNVEAVREKLLARSIAGIKEHGDTTERKDFNLVQWLTHLQEELMDASVYIEAAINKIERPTQKELIDIYTREQIKMFSDSIKPPQYGWTNEL